MSQISVLAQGGLSMLCLNWCRAAFPAIVAVVMADFAIVQPALKWKMLPPRALSFF